MANVGFDFGTTYTSCFRFTEENAFEDLLTPQNSTIPSQPTLAVWNGESCEYGNSAKEELLKPDTRQYRIFRGFKMLIGDMADQNLISRNGYDVKGQFSPGEITKAFLTKMLKKALSACPKDDKKIDTLAVGAPEIWMINNKESFKSLPKFQDIFNTIKDEIRDKDGQQLIGNILFESEPALACAYFAYNYRKKTKKDFNGHMLIIDYGGGTLDINLCEVIQKGESCEIAVREKGGDGVNNRETGILGKAGLAYIQAVAYKIAGDKDISCSVRHSLEQRLESLLIDKKGDIEEEFETAAYDPELKEKLLKKDLKKIEDKHITYGILQEVFDNIISPVLVRELEEMKKKMEKLTGKDGKKLDFENNFKIVLAGGFCDYYLTEKKIHNVFSININRDSRIKDIDMSGFGRRYAIAYGATLIADGKVRIRKTHKFSLGFVNPEGKRFFAFKYGDDVQFGKARYVKRPKERPDDKEITAVFTPGTIPELFYDVYGNNDLECRKPKEIYKNYFDIPRVIGKFYHIGFSLNIDDSISLYIQEVKNGNPIGEPEIRHLPNLFELLYNELEDVSESGGRGNQ